MRQFIAGLLVGLVLTMGSAALAGAPLSVWVNGKLAAATPLVEVDGQLYLPAEPVVEALGARLEWNQSEHRVEITTGADPGVGSPPEAGAGSAPEAGATPGVRPAPPVPTLPPGGPLPPIPPSGGPWGAQVENPVLEIDGELYSEGRALMLLLEEKLPEVSHLRLGPGTTLTLDGRSLDLGKQVTVDRRVYWRLTALIDEGLISQEDLPEPKELVVEGFQPLSTLQDLFGLEVTLPGSGTAMLRISGNGHWADIRPGRPGTVWEAATDSGKTVRVKTEGYQIMLHVDDLRAAGLIP